MTGEAASTFTVLLFAHLMSDFPLQPDRIAKNKRHLPTLSLHIAIVTVTALVVLGYFEPVIILAIMATHFAIDFTKGRIGIFNLAGFLIDQAAHIAVLVVLALYFPVDLSRSLIYGALDAGQLPSVLGAMTLMSGLIVAVYAGTFGSGLLVKDFAGKDAGEVYELTPGGRLTGKLERLLVFLFAVSGNVFAISLLLAAKAILVFSGAREGEDRNLRELRIIGTLASYGWALGASLLALWAAGAFR